MKRFLLTFVTLFLCTLSALADSTIDYLMVYDKNAQEWVTSKGYTLNGHAQLCINQLNEVMENSGITGRFRLVGVLGIDDRLNATQGGLSAATTHPQILSRRYLLQADIVCVQTTAQQGESVGGSSIQAGPLNKPESAVCSVLADASAPINVAHETCHVLGGNHSRTMADAGDHEYAVACERGDYHTLLSDGGMYETAHTHLMMLSGPNNYAPDGTTVMGSATEDNTRMVKEMWERVAGFSDRLVGIGVSETTWNAPSTAESKQFTVTCDYGFTITSSADWVDAYSLEETKNGQERFTTGCNADYPIYIDVQANESSEARTATVTLTAYGYAPAIITIKQSRSYGGKTTAEVLAEMIPLEDASRYGYTNFTITDNDKGLYQEMIKALYELPGGTSNKLTVHPSQSGLSNPTRAHYDEIAARVRFDMPEFYMMANYTTRNITSGEYYWNMYMNYPASLIAEELTTMNAKVAPIVAEAKKKATDYEKALYLHDELCALAHYGNMSSAYAGDIKGILMEEGGVCQGWARTFLWLCQKAGMPCIYVEGSIDKTPDADTRDWAYHAFNYLQIDGKWYLVDCSSDRALGGIGHLYFLKGQQFFDSRYSLCSGGPDTSNTNLAAYPTLPDLESEDFEIPTTTDPIDPVDPNAVDPATSDSQYYTINFDKTKTYSNSAYDDRWMEAVGIHIDGVEDQLIETGFTTRAETTIYKDLTKTGTKLQVVSGETIVPIWKQYTNRLYGYVYLDKNKDGDFDDDGELISHYSDNFWLNATPNELTTSPAYTVTGLAAGDYRIRYVVDVYDSNPGGVASCIVYYAGSITDAILHISSKRSTPDLNEDGKITIADLTEYISLLLSGGKTPENVDVSTLESLILGLKN